MSISLIFIVIEVDRGFLLVPNEIQLSNSFVIYCFLFFIPVFYPSFICTKIYTIRGKQEIILTQTVARVER